MSKSRHKWAKLGDVQDIWRKHNNTEGFEPRNQVVLYIDNVFPSPDSNNHCTLIKAHYIKGQTILDSVNGVRLHKVVNYHKSYQSVPPWIGAKLLASAAYMH